MSIYRIFKKELVPIGQEVPLTEKLHITMCLIDYR